MGDRRNITPKDIQNSLNDFQANAKEFLGVLRKVMNGICSKCVRCALETDIGDRSDCNLKVTPISSHISIRFLSLSSSMVALAINDLIDDIYIEYTFNCDLIGINTDCFTEFFADQIGISYDHQDSESPFAMLNNGIDKPF